VNIFVHGDILAVSSGLTKGWALWFLKNAMAAFAL
jgi:hypothetical protein